MGVTIRTEGLVDRERLRLALQLIREAGDKGITKAHLARRLGNVSSRTVDRAIYLLEEQGARIAKPRRGRPAVIHFTLEKGPGWDEHVSADARLALRLATLSLGHSGTLLWQDKLEALEQLAGERMSNRDRQVFRSLAGAVKVQGGVEDPIETPDVLEPILRALDQGKSLELDYQSVTSRTLSKLEVVPHALSHDLFSGGAFLLAWEPARQRVVNLRLSRIQKAKATRAAAVPDPGLLERAAAYQIGGWTGAEAPFRVVARIEGDHWVQALKEAPPALPEFDCQPAGDGRSARISFKATHSAGASRWLLQFGEQAEVMAPDWLRKEIRTRLEAALRHYKRK